MKKIVSKLLLKLEPIIKWIDKTFTVPYSHKLVTGDHYFMWRDQIHNGHVFLTQVYGAGSNLINPSDINHGAIYFGRGLRSAMEARVEQLNASSNSADHKMAQRLENVLSEYEVRDDVCYVLESIGEGAIPTNLVKFLTTKDIVVVLEPTFADEVDRRNASIKAIEYLGLPYDYAFSSRNEAKYCFEFVADAYEQSMHGIKLMKREYKLLGITLYESFLADTFLDESKFTCIIDSRKQ